jgi:hypothetical protein
MPAAGPSPLTLRLLACVESFSHEEEGAVGHEDWRGLSSVLERELAVLRRLAEEKAGDHAELAPRAEALRRRFGRLSERIEAARVRDLAELASINDTSQRVKAVRHGYLKSA